MDNGWIMFDHSILTDISFLFTFKLVHSFLGKALCQLRVC